MAAGVGQTRETELTEQRKECHMAKKCREKKGSWIVEAVCRVTKEFVCDGCTEEEARSDSTRWKDGTELDCLEILKVTRVAENR